MSHGEIKIYLDNIYLHEYKYGNRYTLNSLCIDLVIGARSDVVPGVVALVVLLGPAELVLTHLAGLVLGLEVGHHQGPGLEGQGAVRAHVTMQTLDMLMESLSCLQMFRAVRALEVVTLSHMLHQSVLIIKCMPTSFHTTGIGMVFVPVCKIVDLIIKHCITFITFDFMSRLHVTVQIFFTFEF